MRKARMASRILRASVAWLLSRKFLATCWVMPEAPSGRLPGLVMLASMARRTPMKSMPGWVKKRWSSAATKASGTRFGMAATGTNTLFSRAYSASRRPSDA